MPSVRVVVQKAGVLANYRRVMSVTVPETVTRTALAQYAPPTM